MNRVQVLIYMNLGKIAITTAMLAILFLTVSVSADIGSVSDFYLRLEGADGTAPLLAAASRFETGYYPYNNTNGNRVVYSRAAKFTGETGVEVYDAGPQGSSAEFNISMSGPFGSNTQPITFDMTKTYRIQFYAKVTKGAFKVSLIRNDSSYAMAMTTPALTPENSGEWALHEITIGSLGTEGINYAYNNYYKNVKFFMRFYCTVAVESSMYLDDIRFTEINPLDIVKDGGFEYLSKENSDFISPDGLWSVDGGTAVYSSAAKYSGNYGVCIAGAGLPKFSYHSSNFDNTKMYLIRFYGKPLNGAYEMDINNSAGHSILANTLKIQEEKYHSILIGPVGSKDAQITYNPDLVEDNRVIIQFRKNGDTGTLYLDNVSCEVETGEGYFTVQENNYLEYTDGMDVYGGLENGKAVKATIVVNNQTAIEKSFRIVFAKYSSNGKLLNISLGNSIDIAPKSNDTVYGYMQLSANESLENNKIKLLILESINNPKPLAPANTFPNKEIKIVMLNEVGIKYLSEPEYSKEYNGAFYVEPMHEVGFPYQYTAW